MGNSDRVTIVWPNASIVNQWLEVTVLPTANTGLAEPDVHYWGNLVGDVANHGGPTVVDGQDLRVIGRSTSFDAAPTNSWDVNRDGWIDANDAQAVRGHTGPDHLRAGELALDLGAGVVRLAREARVHDIERVANQVAGGDALERVRPREPPEWR